VRSTVRGPLPWTSSKTPSITSLSFPLALVGPNSVLRDGPPSGLNRKYPNVVELQRYFTFDEVCLLLAHKVENQRKLRLFQHSFFQPLLYEQTFNKRVLILHSTPWLNPSYTPKSPNSTNQPTSQLKSHTPSKIWRFKCQGFGQLPSDCVNRKVITLAEWTSTKEEKNQEGEGVKFKGEEKESIE